MKDLMKNLLELQILEFGAAPDKKAGSAVAGLRGKIPAQILAHYDRLMARGKKGIAVARNQVCTACHMQLTLGVVMILKRGDDVQLCESCGRYLYLPEETASAPVVPEPPVKPKKKSRRKVAAAAE